ncbi:UBX domain-containing protein 11 isoform X1 [Astyanax mexicanus]|uniref:UBX domain-containing protein 11 n=1 Tax=Astyanax mexicanus TaxID=7994 RepID=A0A8T2MHE3_ASTMX|nr:UBX domain-containing protein 11 isoform X1 [Astyanax mexicanus]
MSSALSTLKKHRRAPLIPAEDQHSSERLIYKEETHTDEALLLGELFPQDQPKPETTGNLTSLRSKVKVMQRRSPKEDCPSDFELMSSMMKRLGQLEKKVKTQALDINSKMKRIAVLEEKLQLLQGRRDRNGQEDHLAERCSKLQRQVWEMEKFLNDYGMIWVGNDEDDDDDAAEEAVSEDQLWRPGASVVPGFSVNFDLVVQNVLDLNILAGEGESCVTSVPGGARLTRPDPVSLQLYKNGIVMFNGPFRSYQDPSTQRCMQDLMDGYFPSELQDRFPDGVIFQIQDRRGEEFRGRRPIGFPGKGHTVGGSEEEPLDQQKETNQILLDHNQSQRTGHKISMERFLSKLPENVVKGGKVISIRSSLKAHLQGSSDGAESHSATVIETPALQALRERLESREAGGSAAEVTTLRVKSEDGEKTFIMKMLFTDTIGHLRQHLDAHRGSSSPAYDIISGFPQQCHSDDTQTLQAYGLTPNAALLLRPRPPETLTTSPI